MRKNRHMRYVDVGGEHLSAIGVGCWQFGSREWAYGKDYADTTAVDIVHRALDLGVNVIDTAEVYGFGKSERIVGRAIAGRRVEALAGRPSRRRRLHRGPRAQVRRAARHRHHRSVPSALAEPDRARVDD